MLWGATLAYYRLLQFVALYYSSIHKIGASRAMAINSSYSGFAILINLVTWNVWPGYEEIILGLLIVGGGVVSAYDFKE